MSTPGTNDATPSGTAASPGSPTAGSATRLGLRTRTPAQQRPYFHHAKIFEEAIDKVVDEPKPFKTKSKLVHVSFPAEELADLEQQDIEDERSLEKRVTGKGRKKLNDEVDMDFKPPKNKGKSADKRKSVATASTKTDEHAPETGIMNGETEKPKKKRGRPPKARPSLDNQESAALDVFVPGQASIESRSIQSPNPSLTKGGRKKRVHKSEDFVHASDEDEEMQDLENEPEPEHHASTSRPAHARRWSGRKSFLSSEYIHDSDDSAVEDMDNEVDNAHGNPITETLHRKLSLSAVDEAEEGAEGTLSDTAVSSHRRKSTTKATNSAPGTAIPSPSVAAPSASAPPSGLPSGSPPSVRKKARRKSKYTLGRDQAEARAAAKLPRRKKYFLSAEIIDDDSDDDAEEMERVGAGGFDDTKRDVEMTDGPGGSVDAPVQSEEDHTAGAQSHVANGTDEEGIDDDDDKQEEEPAPATTPRRTPGRPRRTPQSARTGNAGAANQGTPSKRGKKKSM